MHQCDQFLEIFINIHATPNTRISNGCTHCALDPHCIAINQITLLERSRMIMVTILLHLVSVEVPAFHLQRIDMEIRNVNFASLGHRPFAWIWTGTMLDLVAASVRNRKIIVPLAQA